MISLKASEVKYINYIFNPEMPVPFKYIHPLQVKKVRAFVSNTFSPFVQFIYVFGSSIDLTCHSGSDIDFYVIYKDIDNEQLEKLQEEMHRFGRLLKTKCDFIYDTYDNYRAYADEIGTVEYDVYREGVCVYAAG
jgi:predicted nucleotidyltransferase